MIILKNIINLLMYDEDIEIYDTCINESSKVWSGPVYHIPKSMHNKYDNYHVYRIWVNACTNNINFTIGQK